MAEYQAPVRETLYVMNELLDVAQLERQSRFSDFSVEMATAILEEGGKFAAEVFAPINREGDIVGSHAQDVGSDAGGVGSDVGVVTPEGFREAYQQYVDNAWLSLAQDEAFGGQNLPFTLHMAVSEYFNSANMSLALCPMLTAGAIDVLMAHGDDKLQSAYLAKIVTGEWTATMNLTEAHAGSDLSSLKTKAIAQDDHYLIKGQKIFITWGDHDMTDNIVHIVLAPIEGAVAGVKGLSLFLVPKFLLNAEGGVEQRNDVSVVSTEHKLGINASPTCVMSFGDNDGAIGHLIGEPGDGLRCMFTLMNHARLEVGLEGVAMSERAYQDALEYAKDRTQGRNAATGESAKIIEHADVQRMLMQMKSSTEAMRALVLDASMSHDLRLHADDESVRHNHAKRFQLLTPIVKAWCTELVNEVTSLGIQVYGGMGYIEESGVAQHYRDARITSIYEGTNGIQAADLIGRKLIKDEGERFNMLISEIESSLQSLKSEGDAALYNQVKMAVEFLKQTAGSILQNAETSPFFAGRVAYNFMMQIGYVLGAWYHLRSHKISTENSLDAFYQRKCQSAQFYIEQLLPRAAAYGQAVLASAESSAELSADSFA